MARRRLEQQRVGGRGLERLLVDPLHVGVGQLERSDLDRALVVGRRVVGRLLVGRIVVGRFLVRGFLVWGIMVGRVVVRRELVLTLPGNKHAVGAPLPPAV